MVQGGSRSSSEAHLLRNEVNRNFLASLLSEVPAKMSIFHLPLRSSQSNHFTFQMKKPDTNSGPLLHILPHSKAETRCMQWYGGRAAQPCFLLLLPRVRPTCELSFFWRFLWFDARPLFADGLSVNTIAVILHWAFRSTAGFSHPSPLSRVFVLPAPFLAASRQLQWILPLSKHWRGPSHGCLRLLSWRIMRRLTRGGYQRPQPLGWPRCRLP